MKTDEKKNLIPEGYELPPSAFKEKSQKESSIQDDIKMLEVMVRNTGEDCEIQKKHNGDNQKIVCDAYRMNKIRLAIAKEKLQTTSTNGGKRARKSKKRSRKSKKRTRKNKRSKKNIR